MATSHARKLFEAELAKRGVPFAVTLDGRYRIGRAPDEITEVSVENVARECNRDEGAVRRFVDRILHVWRLPAWPESRTRVYWSAERSDHDFGDALHETVTEGMSRVLVVVDLEVGLVVWVTPDHQKRWGVSRDEIERAAHENLNSWLVGRRPNPVDMHGRTLGQVPIGFPLKTSLIFAPSFRAYVEKDLGWPVLALVPCRDVIFIVPEKDEQLLSYMGDIILDDYREAPYPITPEILRISDEGIEVFATFQPT